MFNGNTALTGCITGELFQWNGGSVSKKVKHHTKLIDAIHIEGNFVYTGAKDFKVIQMDKTSYAVTKTWDFSGDFSPQASICP